MFMEVYGGLFGISLISQTLQIMQWSLVDTACGEKMVGSISNTATPVYTKILLGLTGIIIGV